MKFFFPDSQDQVNPHFEMIAEEHAVHRIRQRDDRYAHEVLRARPFDGLLVAKPIVDGRGGGAGAHYNQAARQRLYRLGVRDFFRLHGAHADVITMGDCGAFTYAKEDEPPYRIDEVIDFYDTCGFDRGVAPDHIIFGFEKPGKPVSPELKNEFIRRSNITLRNADEFLQCHSNRNCRFEPMAAAHGWSPESYTESVLALMDLGYRRIAMGGMVPLRTPDIISTLKMVRGVIRDGVELHLLGVTRVNDMPLFMSYGVTTFDSTSPFFQAFKDSTDNYYSGNSTYVAIRIPQVDGNATLKKLIISGRIDQSEAIKRERRALSAVRNYAERKCTVEDAVSAVMDYESLVMVRTDRSEQYRRTLTARPWENCKCGICDQVGIEVMIFRGSERNKRRGFHNLAVFRDRIDHLEMNKQ